MKELTGEQWPRDQILITWYQALLFQLFLGNLRNKTLKLSF